MDYYIGVACGQVYRKRYPTTPLTLKSIKYEVNFRIRSGIYIDVNYGQCHYVWWNSITNINQFEQVCKQS